MMGDCVARRRPRLYYSPGINPIETQLAHWGLGLATREENPVDPYGHSVVLLRSDPVSRIPVTRPGHFTRVRGRGVRFAWKTRGNRLLSAHLLPNVEESVRGDSASLFLSYRRPDGARCRSRGDTLGN